MKYNLTYAIKCDICDATISFINDNSKLTTEDGIDYFLECWCCGNIIELEESKEV